MVRTTAEGRSNLVRPYRQLAGLTQAQLAEASGITRQTIVAVEAGDYAPSVYLALRLADVLGASVEQLFATSSTAVPPAVSSSPVLSVPAEERP